MSRFHAKSSKGVLAIVSPQLGWVEKEAIEAKSNIYWVVSPEDTELRLKEHKENQRISRIPGMHELCKKVPFAMLMQEVICPPETPAHLLNPPNGDEGTSCSADRF